MGKKPHQIQSIEELADLSIDQLNTEIKRCLLGYQTGGSSQGRRAFFKRLVWLEAERDKLHDVPAQRRRFSR